MQSFAICLAGRFLLREGERHARDRAEFQHGRPCVQAQARACEECEGVWDTRDAQRAAQVEQAVGMCLVKHAFRKCADKTCLVKNQRV